MNAPIIANIKLAAKLIVAGTVAFLIAVFIMPLFAVVFITLSLWGTYLMFKQEKPNESKEAIDHHDNTVTHINRGRSYTKR